MPVSNIRSYARTIASSLASLNSNYAFFHDSPTVTFGLSGNIVTASAIGGGPGGGAGISAGTQSVSTGTVVFSDSNGLSFGMSGSSRITASHDGLRSLSAGTTHALAAGVSFGDGSGVSFGANGSTVTASVAAGATATGNFGALAINAATTYTSGTVVWSNSNGVTFGTNAQTVTASVAAGATATGNLGAIAVNAATTYTSGTVVFSNSNGITFGTNAQTITASVATIPLIATSVNPVASAASTGTAVRYAPEDHRHAGVAVFAAGSNTGNTAGNTATQVGSWVIAGTNGVTVSGSTGAGGVHTAWLSAGGGGGGPSIAINAATTYTNATVVFSNSNGVTFGTNGVTVTASVNAGGGAPNTGVMYENLGPLNTISGALGTFAFTGSHRSILVAPLHPNEGCFPIDISVSTLWLNGSMSGSTATMSVAYGSTIRLGIYTLNVNSLSLLNSASFVFSRAANATNNSTNLAGPRYVPFVSTAWSSNPIFREGSRYWIATHWSSSGALNQSGNLIGAGMASTLQRQGTLGGSTATATSMAWGLPYYGVYTATTAAFPATIGNNQLAKISASAHFVPQVIMVAHTALSNF